jgi:hypothetical protein
VDTYSFYFWLWAASDRHRRKFVDTYVLSHSIFGCGQLADDRRVIVGITVCLLNRVSTPSLRQGFSQGCGAVQSHLVVPFRLWAMGLSRFL